MDTSSLLVQGYGLIEKGGPVMAVLLALSVVALAIILVKLLQFWRCQLNRTGFVERALKALHHGDERAALGELVTSPHPTARVMEAAIMTAGDRRLSAEDRDAEISRVGTAHIRNLESYLRGLEVIANLSPLLGLLGTVMGMIGAFAQLEAAGTKVDPALLAGGIWEALLTTAFGLTVAIPTLGVYHVLEGRVDTVRANMKDATTRIVSVYRGGHRPAAAA